MAELGACEVQQWSPQSVVVRSGQWLPRCYLIAEGGMKATEIDAAGQMRMLRLFLPGDVVGDRARGTSRGHRRRTLTGR